MLTHDIDSDEGLKNLLTAFLPIEEAIGARSVSYIVPCAWPIDHAAVEQIVARGHEVGVHGYDHSNRTAFADSSERAPAPGRARGRLPIDSGPSGTAPPRSCGRGRCSAISAGRYLYDSSIPTSGGLFPVPNNGCATARPFSVEGITEIPLSMPRDGSLRFLGYSAAAIGRLWTQCADAIARSRGVGRAPDALRAAVQRQSGDARHLPALSRVSGRTSGDVRVRRPRRRLPERWTRRDRHGARAFREQHMQRAGGAVRADARHRPRARAARPGIRILDLGCGTGSLVFELAAARPDASITGIDVSDANIRVAREQLAHSRHGDRVSFQQGDYLAYAGRALRRHRD